MGRGTVGISQLCAIQFDFIRMFNVSFILRLKLSLNRSTGPKSKVKAIE